ncbi:10101_t:CDS:1, partial [Ambispora gerdemannii]
MFKVLHIMMHSYGAHDKLYNTGFDLSTCTASPFWRIKRYHEI